MSSSPYALRTCPECGQDLVTTERFVVDGEEVVRDVCLQDGPVEMPAGEQTQQAAESKPARKTTSRKK